MVSAFQKLKNLINNQKTKTIDLNNKLENNWSANGQVNAVIVGEMKALNISVRRGTDKKIMILPEELRPKTTHLISATNLVQSGYVSVNINGEVVVSDSLFVSGSSSVVFTSIYL